MRWKNWKFVYYGTRPGAPGWFEPLIAYHFTLVDNLGRDPFEQQRTKAFGALPGALASPSTAYLYDWNLLPVGQKMALDHLETYVKFPPMQAPASYNLSQVMEEINAQKRMHTTNAAGVSD